MKQFALLILLVSFFFGCNNNLKPHSAIQQSDNYFKYAQNICYHSGNDSLIVYFNWNNSRDSIAYQLPQTAKRIVVLSTTDIAMLNELNAIETIVGVCDPFRISNPKVKERYKNGEILNVGTSMQTNIETILQLDPDIVIATAYSKEDLENYNQLHCPVFFVNSWQENSPLGRVEWIKLLGMLIGKSHEADSTFNVIANNYQKIKSLADSVTKKPLILAGSAYNEIWYLPGGQSYIAKFITDAGGTYLREDEQTGSEFVTFENLILEAQNAKIWIGCDEKTYSELDAANKNYKLLNAYKNKQIYNRSKRCVENGGNDFFEYGFVRPDIVLADYMKIIHPELLPNYETMFIDSLR